MFKRILLNFILIFAVNLFSEAQVCTLNQLPLNLRDGLKAYFPFCSDFNDKSVNSFSGTLNGVVPFVNDRFGNVSSAIRLGAGKITIPSAAFNYQWDADFSLSFWFTNTAGTDYQRLLSTECPEGNFRIAGTTIGGNYALQFGGNYIYDFQQLNQWTHVVYVYSKRNIWVYINGQLNYRSYNNGTGILNYCNPLTIGAKAGTNVDYWGGSFDDLYIYSKALDPCEVKQLYEATNLSVPIYPEITIDLFPDTLTVCGSSQNLSATSNYNYYLWNTGDTTQSISIGRTGKYSIKVANSIGCGTDSAYVSLLNANILENDTNICKGQSVVLHADSSNDICNSSGLPINLRTGLVAFYPFCGNALDAGSNNLNGTTNNLSFGDDRFGKANSSGVFGANGSPSFLSIPANPLLQPLSYSLSAWFNTSVIQAGALGSGLDQVIAGYTPVDWSTGPSYKMFLYVTDNSSLMSRQWTPGTSWQDIVTATGFVSTGNWVHAVTTFDHTTGIQKLYLNGVLYGTRNSILQYNGQVALMIGATYESSSGAITGKFIGKIDDFGLWNRALSDTEISQLYNLTDNQTLSFYWSTGAITKSITVNPSQTTTYYLTVSDGITSCIDSVKIIVATPDTSVLTLDPLQVCASGGASSRLQAASGMSSYQWLKDGVQVSGATNQLFTATQTGNYRVVVRNSLGCQDTSSIYTITFFQPPTGVFQTPVVTDICEGGSIALTASGASSYQWFRNGIVIPGAIGANYNAFLPGTYTVNFVSAQGCIAPSGKNVTLGLLAKPEASFTYDTYCVGIRATFNSTSTISNSGSVDLKWLFADGSSQAGNNVVHDFPRAGAYTVKLVVTPLNCPLNADTTIVTIPVQQPVAGIRYASLNAVLNRTVTLNARSIGTNWLWLPSSNLNDPASRTPLLTPKQEQEYLVRISNNAGCITTDSLLVRIFDERNIYVAGGFTPNNDGKNDRLYPIPVGIAEFRYLRIYNRWGNLVFETNSTDPIRGWDGTYKGKAQPSDTFTWIAEGVDVDGNVVKRTGSSILIR